MELITAIDVPEKLFNTKGVAILDFFASWCGPCKVMEKQLQAIEIDGVPFSVYKLDVEDPANQELVMKHRVSGVPTIIMFVDNEQKDTIVGQLPAVHLKRKIREVYTGSPDPVATING